MLDYRMIAAAILVAPAAAHAGLTGTSVSGIYYFPDAATAYSDAVFSPATFTIGAGEESSVDVEGVTTIHIDFADRALNIDFDTILNNPTWTAKPFNGLVFTGTGLSRINGVTVDPSTDFSGFDASRVSVVGNELRIDWGSLGYTSASSLGFNFSLVPEPATWALMLVGFALVGTSLRRRSSGYATA